ncbi:hypothetical protein N9188_00025 [bacterium]|nr:hypothetical protein [bacterium]
MRNREFDEEVERRLQLAEEERLAAVNLARSEGSGELRAKLEAGKVEQEQRPGAWWGVLPHSPL